MWSAAVIIVIILILIVILLSPITVKIKYTYYKIYAPVEGTPREYVPDRGVSFSLLWGLINLHLRLSYFQLAYRAFTPFLKLGVRLSQRTGPAISKEKTRFTPSRAIRLYTRVVNIYKYTAPAYRYLLYKTTLHYFKWSTGLGLPEAGQTGLAAGALWIIKSNVTSFLYRMLDRPATEPELEVMPEFNRQFLRVNFDCIFSLKTGHIIYTGLLASWFFLINRRKLQG